MDLLLIVFWAFLGIVLHQGQVSERRGVSPPVSSHDLVFEPLPTVPLRRSDCLKDKDSPVPGAIPNLKKKNSVNSGSCRGLLGLSNRQNDRSTITADMSLPTRQSINPARDSQLSTSNGGLSRVGQQSSLPSPSSVSLSPSAATSRRRQGGRDIDNYSRPSPAGPKSLIQGTPTGQGGSASL